MRQILSNAILHLGSVSLIMKRKNKGLHKNV